MHESFRLEGSVRTGTVASTTSAESIKALRPCTALLRYTCNAIPDD
jgi:hypothetical protein